MENVDMSYDIYIDSLATAKSDAESEFQFMLEQTLVKQCVS